MTVHNLAYQGKMEAGLLPTLGLPVSAYTIEGVEYFGTIGFLKAGLSSPTASPPSRRPTRPRSRRPRAAWVSTACSAPAPAC